MAGVAWRNVGTLKYGSKSCLPSQSLHVESASYREGQTQVGSPGLEAVISNFCSLWTKLFKYSLGGGSNIQFLEQPSDVGS